MQVEIATDKASACHHIRNNTINDATGVAFINAINGLKKSFMKLILPARIANTAPAMLPARKPHIIRSKDPKMLFQKEASNTLWHKQTMTSIGPTSIIPLFTI